MPEGGASGDVTGVVDEANNILLSGNLADGTYTIRYVYEDGTYSDPVTLEVGAIVTYTITQKLTAVTSDNSVTEVREGESLIVNLTANDGYSFSTVTVTLNGVDITDAVVSGGTINISTVTGHIVIVAVATEIVIEPSYTNLLPLAVDASGSPYNGGKGYKSGYKMSTGSGNESATTGAYCSGFMPISDIYDYIRVKNITLSETANVNNFTFYDASKTKIGVSTANGTAGAFHVSIENEGNGVYKCRPSSFVSTSTPIAFFRFSCGGITDETIVTVNEEIV